MDTTTPAPMLCTDRVTTPGPIPLTFRCTLPRTHRGEHVATTPEGQETRRWSA